MDGSKMKKVARTLIIYPVLKKNTEKRHKRMLRFKFKQKNLPRDVCQIWFGVRG